MSRWCTTFLMRSLKLRQHQASSPGLKSCKLLQLAVKTQCFPVHLGQTAQLPKSCYIETIYHTIYQLNSPPPTNRERELGLDLMYGTFLCVGKYPMQGGLISFRIKHIGTITCADLINLKGNIHSFLCPPISYDNMKNVYCVLLQYYLSQ